MLTAEANAEFASTSLAAVQSASAATTFTDE